MTNIFSKKSGKLMLILILLIFIQLLISCGSVYSDMSSKKNEELRNFLYGNESIKIEKLFNPNENLRQAIDNLNLDYLKISDIIYTQIKYTNTNLPSTNVLLVSSVPNGSLIIYNHGHDGLPTENQAFAKEFLNLSLSAGYSVLIDSMPLVGLNNPIMGNEYGIIPKGSKDFTTIHQSLLQWPIIHQIYQAIAGPANFMHFFIDGTVFSSMFYGNNINSLFISNLVQHDGIRFNKIHYVGLSGGAFTGLVSCAVISYQSCTLIAGFLPFKYKIKNLGNWGDSEQWADSFFSKYSYEDLINIASITSKNNTYIYNSNDDCCFFGPSVNDFKNENPQLNILIEDRSSHSYNPLNIINLIKSKNY